jgi:hypothetical protein
MGKNTMDYRKFDVLAVVNSLDQVYYRASAAFNPEGTPAWELVKDHMEFNKRTPHSIVARAKKIQEAQ